MTEPTAADRYLDAMRRLVRSFFPALLYFGRYRYAVHSATATTFDGTPVDASVAPALPTGVPYAPSLAGSSCIPAAGTIAHVMFADGDPGQPVCVGFEAGLPTTATIDAQANTVNGSPVRGIVMIGPSADEVDIAGGNVSDATGAGRVVRYGDPIVFSAPGPGTVIPGLVLNHFSKVKA